MFAVKRHQIGRNGGKPVTRWLVRIVICAALMMFNQQSHGQSPVMRKVSPPVPADVPGYHKAHCVSLNQGIRICKGLSDSENTFVLEKDNKRIGTWPGMTFLGETSDFEVLQSDLDADGQRELIIANRDSTSNGLGVNFWTISIFSARDVGNFRPPLTFSVEEYGSSGTFVSNGRIVRILTTRWLWTRDPKGRRGDGLYLTGQWWRYSRGELIPSSNRAILARRYLESFAVERGRTGNSPAIPYKWLSGPKAERLRFDPILAQKNSETEGVITGVSAETSDERRILKIEFKPDRGAPLSFIYPQDDSDENGLAGIGDFSSNRVYPSGYIPTSPDGWLKGQRATVVTYGENERRILWLKPKSD